MMRELLRGAAAGAAGTTALSAVTYADMAWRGRPASSTPQQSVEKLAKISGTTIPGEGETRQNRVSGLGSLMGLVTGVAVGGAYGFSRAVGIRPPTWLGALLVGAGAVAGSSTPMTAMGITDPRKWSAASWASDIVPHIAYGVVTAATYAAEER